MSKDFSLYLFFYKNISITIREKTMKKNILTALAMLAIASTQTMMAIPADPQAKKMRQPDGSYVTVMMRGDEHCHMLFSADGTPLFYNAKTHAFEYAQLKAGRLSGSGIIAKDAADRDMKAKAYVAKMDMNAIQKAVLQNRSFETAKSNGARKAGSPKRIRINDFPTIGHQKSLVILWEFSDTDFTSIENPKQFFNGLLNTPGFTWEGTGINGSAVDFYHASSFNKFDPEFDVVGPVKLSKPASYYGSDNPSQDAMIYEAIIESCQALDDEINFADYDTDNDGKVDNIYFFYAGNGQADTPNGTELIWPHSWYLGETGWKQDLVLDGKQIDRYTCSNELRYKSDGSKVPTGIGTFVHEFGHVLGLADHYDVSYGMLTFGLGAWDTMASGSYNNDMNTPPVFSAFERAELGWLDYTDLNIDADSINVLPYLADCNKAYRIKVDGTNDNEYFILENRQKTGWDKYLPGHGMLTWHIDMDEAAWKGNYVNTDMTHQRVDIVEVDGTATDATRNGDIMPGASNITQYQLKSWAGNDLLKIDHVAERNDTIRMILAGTKFKIPAPESVLVSDIKDSSFVATWTPVDDATSYTVSAYTTDKQGNKTYLQGLNKKIFPQTATLNINRLTPLTDYEVSVSATLASYNSDNTTVPVQTLPLVFSKRMPNGLTATDITSDGFKASWNDVEGATDYLATLYHHTFNEQTTDKGYDFTEKYDGLPELWNTNSQTYYSVKGYYGSAAPSLRLSNDNDYLIVAYPESKMETLSFWARSSKAGNKIHIEAEENGEWNEIKTIDAPTTAQTIKVATDGAAKVRIRLERTSGFVVIDDVVASIHETLRTPVDGNNEVKTEGKTSLGFNGLTGGEKYSFRIQASDGTDRSYRSDECVVVLPAATGISNISNEEGKKAETFDLVGRKLADSSKGCIIVKNGKQVKKIFK